MRYSTWLCRSSPPGPAHPPPRMASFQRVQKDARHAGFLPGDVEFRSRVVRSDAGYCGCAVPSPVLLLPSPPPPPIIPFVTPPPPFLCKRLFTGLAASANQEHSSPMRWHERPTLRSSFTILRTASSRPRPRWSNRQSCCSGRRWSMQNTYPRSKQEGGERGSGLAIS